MNVLISLLVLIFVAGGTSVAAQNSRPGDLLYPVKVSVTEKVKEALSFSDELKANVILSHAEERLKEAEDLVVKSDLSADVRAQIEANFTEHVARVRALITKLAAVDSKVSADIASNLETSLNAHERILTQLSEKSAVAAEKPQVDKLKVKVSEEAKVSEDDRNASENEMKTQPAADVQAAAEGRIGAAENKIAEVKTYLESMKAALGATATAQAEARLATADSTLVSAKAKLTAQSYNEAFVLASESLRTAQEAKLMVQSRVDLKVDLDVGGERAQPERGEGLNFNLNLGTEGGVDLNEGD